MRIMDCVIILFRRKINPNEPDPERACPKPSWAEAGKVNKSCLTCSNTNTCLAKNCYFDHPYFIMAVTSSDSYLF